MMINVKSKNLKQLPLISHVFHYFFGNNFSMLTFIYLGATSYVSITLVSLLITISLQKYQEKKLFKKENKVIYNPKVLPNTLVYSVQDFSVCMDTHMAYWKVFFVFMSTSFFYLRHCRHLSTLTNVDFIVLKSWIIFHCVGMPHFI